MNVVSFNYDRQPNWLESHPGTLAERVEMVTDDVTQICQRVPFLEVAPATVFSAGLISELAEASDRLAATVAKLQEQTNG